MHHHPEALRQAMRAREHELHARAARMRAVPRVPHAAVREEPVAPLAAPRGLGALVSHLVPRRPRPAARA